jgi:hypothetical protein
VGHCSTKETHLDLGHGVSTDQCLELLAEQRQAKKHVRWDLFQFETNDQLEWPKEHVALKRRRIVNQLERSFGHMNITETGTYFHGLYLV